MYERIAELPAFREGLARVIESVGRQRLALMCAEKEPLDCHRTILVCRHLRNQGIAIRHILADGEAEDHAAAERRLLRLTKEERTLFEPDVTEEELLGRAVRKARPADRVPHVCRRRLAMTESALPENKAPITLFTIGFAGKSAEEFFAALRKAGVERLIDVRLNNVSQLAGFTKRRDLEYFLRIIAGIEYEHNTELRRPATSSTPTRRRRWRGRNTSGGSSRSWTSARWPTRPAPRHFDHACLLCSEPQPDRCHRRLVAEYLQRQWPEVVIEHL